MKKVGIITYHFANNYGAMLQCYALYSAIHSMNNDVEVLNFISEKQFNNNALYRKGSINNHIKNFLLLPFHLARAERQRKTEAFRQDCLHTGIRLHTLDELRSYVQASEFDYLFSGSDQVWNPHVEDFEDAFFYPFFTDAKKVGYAVSVGKATQDDLLPYQKWIQDFDTITVRENSSCKMVSDLANKSVDSIVDPVFLLTASEWLKIIPERIISDDYLLCYFVKKENYDDKIAVAQKMAEEKKLKLIIVNPRITKYNLSKTVISNAGPLDFLSYLKNATFVCTDSFHGTVFSIIFEKEFRTIELTDEGRDSRKTDILNTVGLLDRVFYLGQAIKKIEDIKYDTVTPTVLSVHDDAKEKLKKLLK